MMLLIQKDLVTFDPSVGTPRLPSSGLVAGEK